jgi:hypothetical protein
MRQIILSGNTEDHKRIEEIVNWHTERNYKVDQLVVVPGASSQFSYFIVFDASRVK